ncbi:radical SAM protein, partial [bacterium]|nr:radical SAM protein [bacterium]
MKKTYKNKRIFFVYPPSIPIYREDRCQQPLDITLPSAPNVPLDMMTLSAVAKRFGYQTKFKDYSLVGENVHDFIRDLRDFKPDFLIINVASSNLDEDLSILEEAHDILDKTFVIAKGTAFNFHAYSIMQKYPDIDIVLKGEGEDALAEILSYKYLKDIKGIVYQVNNAIFATPPRKTYKDLDSAPNPDRDLIDNSLYLNPLTKKPQTVIRVSKGCPYHCFFCLATPINGEAVKYRSEDLIIEEIRECIEKYNIHDFVFLADIFNYDKERIKRLCHMIIQEGFNITYSTSTRADSIDEETLKLMKKSGCELLTMGVESASQEILDKIGKKLTISQIENAVKMIEKQRIKLHCYYVLGLPWENATTLENTYKFACKLNTQYASFFMAAALSGTKFFDYINKKRLAKRV